MENQQIKKGDVFFAPGGGTVEVQKVSGCPNSDGRVDVFFVGAECGLAKALMVSSGFVPSTNGRPDKKKYGRTWGLPKKCNVPLKPTQVLLEFDTEEQAREFKKAIRLDYLETMERRGFKFDCWNSKWNYLPQLERGHHD